MREGERGGSVVVIGECEQNRLCVRMCAYVRCNSYGKMD
jgi:hypothetical protein